MKAGDDIYVDRGAYPHHGIYVHDKQVIHTNDVARVTCTTLERFAEGAEVQVREYGEERCFDYPDVVERAKSQIGHHDHKFEHFPTWCITGDADEQDLPIDIQRFGRRDASGDEDEVPGSDSFDEYLIHPQLPETEDDVSVLPLMVLVTATEELGGFGSGPLRSQMESDVRLGPVSEGGRILDSLKAYTPDWRAMLAEVLVKQDLTPAVLGFACAVLNPLLPAENVGGPRINNRIDGVLDMLSCEFTAADAQRPDANTPDVSNG